MTTYTLTGFSLTNDMSGGFTAAFFETPATLEIVVEDGQGIFSYVTTSAGETPPRVDIDITGLQTARVNGNLAIDAGLEPSIGILTWDDGGVTRTTIFLSLDEAATGLDYIFAIGGDPFPVLPDLAAFNTFASTQIISVDGVTSGPFAPGENIPMNSFLNVAITENDTILGTVMDDVISGGAGNDIIEGLSGLDSLEGGAGNDIFILSSDNLPDSGSTFDGGAGIDTLRVEFNSGFLFDLRSYNFSNLETLEIIFGATAEEVQLSAAQFNSNFTKVDVQQTAGTFGYIVIKMGTELSLDLSGVDFSSYNNPGDAIIIEGDGTSENIIGSDVDDSIFAGLGNDTLNGGDGDDWLLGQEGADTINGGDGDDIIDGGLGSGDVMNGDAGNDTIRGGFGNDIIDGGAGIDTVDYSGFGGSVTVNLNNNGSPQTSGGGGIDVITNVENIDGGDFADRLTGRGGDSEIYGGGGSDLIFGLGGDDVLVGEDGNDFIQGGNGNDIIFGGFGQDQLNGGNDNDSLVGGDDNSLDRLTGGAGNDLLDGEGGRDILRGDSIVGGVNVTGGNDIFDFNEVNDSLAGGLRDIIRDFVQGEDLMDLSDVDAITGGVDDDFIFIGTSDFTGTAGEMRYQFGGSNTVISMDVDGDGIADMQIQLNGNIDLLASDFVL